MAGTISPRVTGGRGAEQRVRSRGWSPIRRIARRGRRDIALAAAAVSVALVSMPLPGFAATAAATQLGCAWPAQGSADQVNLFYPDSDAQYWVQPFAVQDGLRIVLSGSFPDSRYASFTVYRGLSDAFTTNGVASTLTDYQITPDAGSVNPWQQPAQAGGRFTLTLRADAAPGQVNTLPLAPAGTAPGSIGYLVYRVYQPAGGASSVALPKVTTERNGQAVSLPACTGSRGQAASKAANLISSTIGTTPVTPPKDIRFARPPAGTSIPLPNVNSGYLAAVVTPPADPGQVVVVRGLAPNTSSGSHPSVWPSPGTDLRYRSLCTYPDIATRPVVVNRPAGQAVDYGCRDNDQTKLDAQGYYTYVIGTEAQRAAIERIPGVTFVPFSTANPSTPHVVAWRNMLPADGFAAAVQNVPNDGNADSAAAVMGPYYPKDAICPLATLASTGVAACPGLS